MAASASKEREERTSLILTQTRARTCTHYIPAYYTIHCHYCYSLYITMLNNAPLPIPVIANEDIMNVPCGHIHSVLD